MNLSTCAALVGPGAPTHLVVQRNGLLRLRQRVLCLLRLRHMLRLLRLDRRQLSVRLGQLSAKLRQLSMSTLQLALWCPLAAGIPRLRLAMLCLLGPGLQLHLQLSAARLPGCQVSTDTLQLSSSLPPCRLSAGLAWRGRALLPLGEVLLGLHNSITMCSGFTVMRRQS